MSTPARRDDASGDGLRAVAGTAFILLAAQFMIAIMAGASIAPGYDVAGGAISDLGIAPSTALLFNAALIVTGALNITGAVALSAADRRAVPSILALLAGAGALGAGFFPLDTGQVHSIFALLAFLFFNLQIVPSRSGCMARSG